MAEGEKSSATRYILIGCGLSLLLGVCTIGSCFAFCGGGMYYVYEQTEEPAAEARAFLEDLGKNDLDAAFARTSRSYRARVTKERLGEALAARGGLGTIRDITLPSRSLSSEGEAHLAGTIRADEAEIGVELVVIKENDAWRVDSVRLAGVPLE